MYDPSNTTPTPTPPPNIPIEVMQNILTDQMVKRLSAIESHLEKSIPLYPPDSKVVNVTDVPVEVNLGVWVRATLFNNPGSANVYVYFMRQTSDTRNAYLAAGDHLPIDRGERTTERFYLVCASGLTAAVRIFYE